MYDGIANTLLPLGLDTLHGAELCAVARVLIVAGQHWSELWQIAEQDFLLDERGQRLPADQCNQYAEHERHQLIQPCLSLGISWFVLVVCF